MTTETVTMSVSMDGLRYSMGHAQNDLHEVLTDLFKELEDRGMDEHIEAIKDKFNDTSQSIGAFYCIYDDTTENFSNMGTELDFLDRFDDEEDEENGG